MTTEIRLDKKYQSCSECPRILFCPYNNIMSCPHLEISKESIGYE